MRLLLLFLVACGGNSAGGNDKFADSGDTSSGSDDSGSDGPVESNCNDEADNDMDGSYDCADTDCTTDPACLSAEDCYNERDDDQDGLTDCDDSDCAAESACQTLEDCGNRLDDDQDSLADCDDPDCAEALECATEDCSNDTDDDGDGQTDCDDQDCARDSSCATEDCGDSRDNDGDGLSDCDDADCAEDAACIVCYEQDLGTAFGAEVATGSTAGQGNDRDPSCTDHSGIEDVVFRWEVPSTGTWAFSTDGSVIDSVLTLEVNTCGVESDCNDDNPESGLWSYLEADLIQGDVVYIDVDGYSASGDYVLSITALQ